MKEKKLRFKKFKKTIRVVSLVLLFMVVGLGYSNAQDFEVDNLLYTVLSTNPPTVSLDGHIDGTSASDELIIPETVENGGETFTVVAIGDSAFAGCTDMYGDIVIPNTVLTIGDQAFDNSGFDGNVIIGSSVTTIGNYAFAHLGSTGGDLHIPNSVTQIGDYAFYQSFFDGSFVMSNAVVSIGEYAFYDCNQLTISALNLPSTLTSIGDYAFYHCSSLSGRLTLSTALNSVGAHSFDGCGFTQLNFGSTSGSQLQTIGAYAFANCGNMGGNLSFPVNLQSVGEYAFSHCGFNGNLTLRNVQNIGAYAFQNVPFNDKGLTIPATLSSIGDGAFLECFQGGTLTFNTQLSTIPYAAFWNCGFTGTLTIPNSVTQIESYAFGNCSGFTSVSFPEGVESILDYAFYNCSGLTMINSLSLTPPTLGEQVFSYVPKSIPVYVPCGYDNAYTSINWGDFTNIAGFCSGTITVAANPTNGGTVTGGGFFEAGELCTVTATANTAFVFANWTKNGVIVSNNAEYTFPVAGDMTLVANFILDEAYNNLVLNELNGDTKFIEIYNKGNIGLVLGGLYIEKDNNTDPIWIGDASITIPAYGYVVLYSEDVLADHPELEGTNYVFNGGLSGKKAIRVALFLSDGTQLDIFTRCPEGEEWGAALTNVAPQSYARTPDGGDWKLADATPGEANPATGEVIPDLGGGTTPPSPGPSITFPLFEPFEEYTVGNNIASEAISAGHGWWTTWSNTPGSSEDGVVAELEGTKCGHFIYGNDQVILFGDIDNGNFDLEFDIYVPNGKNGYFNVLHDFAGSNSTWAMQCYLHLTNDGQNTTDAPGHGTIHAGSNSTADISCVYDAWMHFRLNIDTDTDIAKYYYTAPGEEEQLVCTWQWSFDSFGENTVGNTLAAMNFYPPYNSTTSEFYVDNFKLTKIEGSNDGLVIVTDYDFQSNHFVSNRMYQLPDGSVGVVATMSHEANQVASDRGTGYNFYKNGQWLDQPESRIEPFKTGWPSIAQWGETGEILLCHGNGHLQCFTREVAGEGEWVYRGNLPDHPEGYPYDKYAQWPRVVTSGNNHNIVHVVAALQYTDAETITHQVYYRSEDAENWEVSYGPIADLGLGYEVNQFNADNYALAANGHNVAILYSGSITNSVWMFKSNDDGLTWEATRVWEDPYEGISLSEPGFAYTDTLYRPMNGSIVIDNNGVAHVALNTFEMAHWAETTTGNYTYWKGRSVDGILYWNDTQLAPIQSEDGNPHHAARLWWPDEEELDCIKMHPDSTKWIGYTPTYGISYGDPFSWDNDKFYQSEYYSIFYGASGHPALSCDPYGNLACAYSSPCGVSDNGSYYYRHIYVSFRDVNDGYWHQAANDITDSDELRMTDNLFTMSVPNTVNAGEFWFGFQSDSEIGLYWGNNASQTSPTENNIVVKKVMMDIDLSDKTITVTANPATGGVITGAGTYGYGTSCTLTASANEGYRFVNWTKDSMVISSSPTLSFIVTESGSYVANFELYNTFTTHITGYSTNPQGGWYLLASPLNEEKTPDEVGMITLSDYDLYVFDENEQDEWRNYKQDMGNFTIVPGKGYLYSNIQDVDITFTGTPNSGDFSVTLSKKGVDCKGWNLVGNPFGVEAYIDRPYYVLNDEGTALLTESCTGAIAVMEGVFVQAASDGEEMTFTTINPGKGSTLSLNVTQNSSVVDRIIVNFGEGGALEKFQLNANSTKVYMPVEGKDYAVVSASSMGEIPVSFKADANGTYTISFNIENIELAYLHLIDNLTGSDVDLLATPSYTFDAQYTDYASRFELVFATTNTSDDQFAFISDGEIILSGINGNTIVQLFDVTGRMIGSTNGASHISTENMAAGVYMLRLINGNDVKTQKIVVK